MLLARDSPPLVPVVSSLTWDNLSLFLFRDLSRVEIRADVNPKDTRFRNIQASDASRDRGLGGRLSARSNVVV